MSCVGCRRGSDLVWLWHRPAAVALIGPLAWEPPYAAGVAQEMAKRQKKKKSLEGNNSIIQEAEEQKNEVEDRLVEITDVEWNKEKRMKRIEDNLKEL